MSLTMPLSTVEDLGFQALATSGHRPTWIEGGLIAGAIAVSALLSFASRSRAELSEKEIRDEYNRHTEQLRGNSKIDFEDFKKLIRAGAAPSQITDLEYDGDVLSINELLYAYDSLQRLRRNDFKVEIRPEQIQAAEDLLARKLEVFRRSSEVSDFFDKLAFIPELLGVGSPHLDRRDPTERDIVRDYIRLGLGPEHYAILGENGRSEFVEYVVNDTYDPEGAKEFVDLVKQITAKYGGRPFGLENDKTFFQWWPYDIHKSPLALKELLDLDLDPYFIREADVLAFEKKAPGSFGEFRPKVDKQETLKRLKDYQDAPHEMLRQLGIDSYVWRKWSNLDEEEKSLAYALAAARGQVQSSPMKLYIDASRRTNVLSPMEFGVHPSAESIRYARAVERLVKNGKLRKIDKLLTDKSVPASSIAQTIYAVDKLKLNIPDTYGELQEMIALALGTTSEALKGGDPQKPKKRFFDRLAQMDPAWAISEFKDEYERGKRIAPVVKDAIDYIVGRVQAGDTIFIHGRDGELLYELLKQRSDVDLSKIRYGLTSRPLTTQAKSIDPKYMAYLKRVVPENAVHIDTGFAGSIPKWLKNQGFAIKDIKMVSATNKSEEIPRVSSNLTDRELRDLVLGDLEHSSQRLEVPSNTGFNALTFSDAAPGFWARFYGVIDALELPKARLAEATRFEKRYRIAVDPDVAPSEDVEAEQASKMKK